MGYSLKAYIKRIRAWPIARYGAHFTKLSMELSDAIIEDLLSEPDTEEMISTAIAKELGRVETKGEQRFWQTLQAKLKLRPIEETLREMIQHYLTQRVTPFKVFAFLMARFLGACLLFVFHLGIPFKKKRKNYVNHAIAVKGDIERLRQLDRNHTLLFVAPHISQFDTLFLGIAIDRLQLSFPTIAVSSRSLKWPVASYMINRLGLYMVGFKKRPTEIHLASFRRLLFYMTANRVNNLIYPSSKRSKTGKVETSIKTGLLKKMLEAQAHCQQLGLERKIYLVPIVPSYSAVFEASYLIRQGTRSAAQSRGIVSMLMRLMQIIRDMLFKHYDVEIAFGEPVALTQKKEHQTRTQYHPPLIHLKELKTKLIDQFIAQQIVRSSHLISYVAFDHFLQLAHDDLKLLLYDHQKYSCTLEDLKPRFEVIQKYLFQLAKNGRIQLSKELHDEWETVVKRGVQQIQVFQVSKPLTLNSKGHLTTEDLRLLYYYYNRLHSVLTYYQFSD